MITVKVDVTKIDKTKLFRGKKGVYLDLVLIDTPNSDYGDYMVVQELSKAERDAGKKGNILGNAKILQQRQQAAPPPPPKQGPVPPEDDVPF